MALENDQCTERFTVEVELANNQDLTLAERGFLPAEHVRRIKLHGVVDAGATRLVLSAEAAERLGLTASGEVKACYADGRTERRALARNVRLSYVGRSGVFSAVIEPQRQAALIGRIVLEELDLVPDHVNHTLAPRDPRWIVSDVE